MKSVYCAVRAGSLNKIVHASYLMGTRISCSKNFLSENRVVYKMMWKYTVQAGQATDNNIILRMRFERWIYKATDTHSEYVILIVFPLQQWLNEGASELR